MWCHLPTGFKRRSVLQFVALALLFIAFFTTLMFTYAARAAEGVNQTLSFQGRLLQSTGAVVPDGHYNIQFKIYQDGAGTAVDNPGGSLKWTETHINNGGTNGVFIKNGQFSVNLGAVTPFGNSIDWNQDTLWLSMNVAGSATACTSYGTAPCAADGEMLPMKRLTSTPFAINSAQLGGKTADNFIQLAQGVQTDSTSNTSSLHINKTGTGNLVQLQNNGSDVFSVTNSGNLEFGSSADHAIYVGGAAPNTAGRNLTIFAGYGGSGSGSMGGGLFLQGGGAGGDNGEGGSVSITGGSGTGTGKDGSVYIGATDTDTVQIGSTNQTSGTQTINIGNNSGAGSTDVVIGSTGTSGGGETRIQSKENTTIATDGVDRAVFDTNGNLTLGNGVSNNTPADFRIQGTSSSASGVTGGNLTVQGGNATTGNANGGNLNLSGGSGSGTGSKGLVVIDTPTYASAAIQSSAVSANVTQSNIDSFGVVTLNATAANVNFTLGAPSLGAGAAGRIVYVTAANGSQNFNLRANTGGGAGVEQNIPMKQNTSATMIWNGSLWTAAGSAGGNLQAAYDNSAQGAGGAEMTVNNGTGADGLTVRDGGANTTAGPLLDVQSSSSSSLFSVNNSTSELASNPGAEVAGTTPSTFPLETWGAVGTSTISRQTTTGPYVESGRASLQIAATGEFSGAYNLLKSPLSPGQTYSVSMSVKLQSGSMNDFAIFYVADGSTISNTCTENVAISTSAWTKVTCSFQAPTSGITENNTIAFGQVSAGNRTFYIDNMSVVATNGEPTPQATSPSVKIGGGEDPNSPTLFTLDKSATPASSANSDALLGSMYYDTTLGKVQCFEADGWGDCGSAPDTFVTLSPEFAGSVVTGSGTGTMSTNMCSDQLNINDGSSSQPTVCGTNETYNYYNWTSTSGTNQLKSIYVNYQLPQNFKQFISGSTSILGRTDNNNSTVAYQMYRNDATDGLIACSTEQPLSNGPKTVWQKGTPGGIADPATCGFEAGDTLVVKIVLGARSSANSYVSNLSFAHSIK